MIIALGFSPDQSRQINHLAAGRSFGEGHLPGLVPREWSSGEGHRRVRSLLVQAAVSIRRVPHPTTTALREWAERLAARRGRFITVVALARRLAGLLYALLRDGTRYEPPRLAPAPRTAAAT